MALDSRAGASVRERPGKFYVELREQLALYVRHAAWLNAVPDKDKLPRIDKLLERDSPLLQMPPIDVGDYLIAHLYEIGPGKLAGMGYGPIDQIDLAAYQLNHDVRFQPWECRMLRHLSRDYCDQARKSTDKKSQPPYIADITPDEQRRRAVDRGFRLFAQLAKTPRS